jgi:hypothetical protein
MLLCAAVNANWRDSKGISGCTQYSRAKQEKPPKNKARLLRLKAALPAEMRAVTGAVTEAEAAGSSAAAVLAAEELGADKAADKADMMTAWR